MTYVTSSEQEEEDEDADYFDNLYGDKMESIQSQDSNVFAGNSEVSGISTSELKVNSRERRHVRLPKALADYDLS